MEALTRSPVDDLGNFVAAQVRDTGATDRAKVRAADGQAREGSRLETAALFWLPAHFDAGPIGRPFPATNRKPSMVRKCFRSKALQAIF